jgi:membrane-associated phospholipid phosphatase
MKLNLFFLLMILVAPNLRAQRSPYHTRWKTDLPFTAAGIGLSAYGLKLIGDKNGLSQADLVSLSRSDINRFDRFSAGWYSESADKNSYYPFFGSFAMPVMILLDGKVNDKTGQVLGLYVETMAVTATLYSLSAGTIRRNRPYTYGTEAPLKDRTKNGATRSFYAGHVAATSSAAFFAAKVFSDFNPDSKIRPFVWTAAAVLPAAVGYMRLKAGMHFLSDNMIGYGIGMAAGVLIPQLHKTRVGASIAISPVFVPGYQLTSVTYTF